MYFHDKLLENTNDDTTAEENGFKISIIFI